MIGNHIYPAVALLASLLTTAVVMPWLLRFCLRHGLYDMPGGRKVHKNRTPRLGGTLFIPSALVGITAALLLMQFSGMAKLTFKASTFIILSGAFLIYLIGLFDDVFGLRASLKFAIQFIAALFMPLCGLYLNNLYGLFGVYEIPMAIGYPLTIFVALLIVNAINLIDGIDGLASGLSVIALATFYILFTNVDVLGYQVLIAALSGSVLVFMYFNLAGSNERGTKTFMGDTGSLFLGYSIAFLAIKYTMANEQALPPRPEPLLTSFSIVIVPTFDLIRVALSRLWRGVSIFHADKTHLHHLYLAAGCSMRGALVCILLLQVSIAAMNYLLYRLTVSTEAIMGTDLIVLTIVYLSIKRRIARRIGAGTQHEAEGVCT